jgi:hypothetical protein
MQGRDRHGQLLGQGPGPATADADLGPEVAHVLPTGPAARAAAAAEHGVPGGPAPEQTRVDAPSDGGDGAAPLVPEPERKARVAGVQVLHLSAEELHVGAAHPDPVDVDDDLPGARGGRSHLAHRPLPRRRDHEGAHQMGEGDGLPCMAIETLDGQPEKRKS